jgi:hypothetical protein
MKRLLLAVAAIATLSFGVKAADVRARPVIVQPCVISGIIGAYGSTHSAEGYYTARGSGIGGHGKVNFCHAAPWGLQWDGAGEAVSAFSGDFQGLSAGQFGTVAHVYMRDPSTHAFGVLVGVGKLIENYSSLNPGFLAQVGLDGHVYFGNTTFAGQAVYMRSVAAQSTGYATIDHGYTLLGEIRHFFHPNLKVAALAGWHWDTPVAPNSSALPIGETFFGASGELKLGPSPFSIFGSVVRRLATPEGTSDRLDTTTFKFGVAGHFNQPTLLAEDRNGASFNTPMVDSWQHLDNAYYR